MELPDEWHQIIHDQLEQVAQYLRELTPPRFHMGANEPTIDQETTAMEQKLFPIFLRMEKGMKAILNLMSDPPLLETLSSNPDLPKAMGAMASVATVLVRNMPSVVHQMAQGEALQHIFSISDDSLNSMYSLAKYLYDQQQYEEACGAFYFLSFLNPSYHLFWIGLGNCEYIVKRYSAALAAYAFALQTETSDPKTHLLIARCYIGLGNSSAATASLSLAELICTDRKTLQTIKEQAEQIRRELRGETV